MFTVTVGGVSRKWQTFEFAIKDILVRGEGLEWSADFTIGE